MLLIRKSGSNVAACLLLAATLTTTMPARAESPPAWSFFGGDIANTRGHNSGSLTNQASFQINPRTAGQLALKWSTPTIGDVSATPTAEAGGVYFPDYAGYLYRLDPQTGATLWSKSLAGYMDGVYGYSRSSPAIGALGEVVIGNNAPNGTNKPGARVLSIDKADGSLNWIAIVDVNPNAFVTTSPMIYDHKIFVGVVSLEEALAASRPGFEPTFRGSVVALDEATGRILWKFYTTPAGYAGVAVWGSSPAVWARQRALFVTTGNNYAVPDAVARCYLAAGASKPAQFACMDPTNYVDSILSLNLDTGKLNWARRFAGADTWTVACSRGPESACPVPAGKDYDFASGANLAWVDDFVGAPDDHAGTSQSYVLGAGQKTGDYWALNPVNGGLFWTTNVGRGQIMWGSAVNTDDHDTVYVPLANTGHISNVLAGQNDVSVTSRAGAWAAIDIKTGAYRWQVPTYGPDLANPAHPPGRLDQSRLPTASSSRARPRATSWRFPPGPAARFGRTTLAAR